jgi:hypothetical protein
MTGQALELDDGDFPDADPGAAQDPVSAFWGALLPWRHRSGDRPTAMAMVFQHVDSRRDGAQPDGGDLVDIYELREGPDGAPVTDPARIEAVLDDPRFQALMERLGPTARASITGAGAGVLHVRARSGRARVVPQLFPL